MIRRKHIIIILTLIIMLGVAALYFLFLLEIKKQQNSIIETREQSAIVDEKQKNIRSLEALLTDVVEEKEMIENVFVNQKSVVRFIEELESIALLSGAQLTIQQVVLPAGQSEGPVFLININGSFEKIFRYLNLLENAPFQISFENIDFIKQTLQEGENIWSLRIRLRLLSYIY